MCAGRCNTYQTSYIRVFGQGDKKIGNKQCKCCGADDTRIEMIDMTCGNNEKIQAEYVRIESCKCDHCDSVNNSDESFTNDLF